MSNKKTRLAYIRNVADAAAAATWSSDDVVAGCDKAARFRDRSCTRHQLESNIGRKRFDASSLLRMRCWRRECTATTLECHHRRRSMTSAPVSASAATSSTASLVSFIFHLVHAPGTRACCSANVGRNATSSHRVNRPRCNGDLWACFPGKFNKI